MFPSLLLSVGIVCAFFSITCAVSAQNYDANSSAEFNAILSGDKNIIQTNASFVLISGGQSNLVTSNSYWATIAGGFSNTVSSAWFPTIGGGFLNLASNWAAAVGGGSRNTASGYWSTVAGGQLNMADGGYAFIGGGSDNQASYIYSAVGGGFSNAAIGGRTTVGGGSDNTASGYWSTVGGGEANSNNAYAGVIGGGSSNLITVVATNGVLSGGQGNNVGGRCGFVGGGAYNTAGDTFSTVVGGYQNTASNIYSTVSGGYGNAAGGAYATVPGGARSKAIHAGSFVWSGDATVETTSTNARSFTVRASGGVRFITATNTAQMRGAILRPNATAWTSLSDRESKTDFQPIKPREVLSKLAAMPVTSWSYKHDPSRRYIGPTSQDFMAAFHLGDYDKGINTLDADGVMYAAIQGLVEELKERDKTIEELEIKLQAVEQRLNWLPSTH